MILPILFLAAGPWLYPDRPYRIRAEVHTGQPRTPVTVSFDPGAALAGRGEFDPASLAVGHGSTPVPARISEGLEAGLAGTITWLNESPSHSSFEIYFDIRRAKPRPPLDRHEPIGAGDAFFHNRPNGFDHLGVGMKNDQPIAVDWDGDGKIDLLQRNLYSATYGEPWWGIYFWRNIGTNQAPRFDRYVRLRADGRFIEDFYASYQLIDWNHDGKLDLLSGVGAGKQRGQLKIYLNTGARDALGLPILAAGPTVPPQGGGELTYGMRLLDWAGRGVQDLFTTRMKVQYFPTQEMDFTLYRHANRAAPGETPRFDEPSAVELAGRKIYDAWPSSMLDVNGDGKPDLIGSTRGLSTRPPQSCVLAWENTGTTAEPAFAREPRCIWDTSPEGFAIPTAISKSAAPFASKWQGMLVGFQGGWLRFVEQLAGKFVDRGPLLAQGTPVEFGGYSSVEVVDWDGDGDLDFVAGNEVGFVQLAENVDSNGRTMFKTARQIPLEGGGTMYAGRWQFIDDMDPERPLGQSKPAVVDWDGDGDLDVLVGNNSNRIAYFENIGTRRAPRFGPMKPLVHDNVADKQGNDRFSFRARPAPVDWNRDGLLDLVAGSSAGRDRNDGKDIAVCLYLRYRAAGGTLRLREGQPFRLVDGTELRTPIPYHHGFEAVDWDGDGDFDLFTNERSHVIFYRNLGSNAKPVFRREEVKLFGKPLSVSHHETSVKAIDWDGDGKLDLVTGGESGWVYYFRRAALEAPAPPVVNLGSLEIRREN